MKLQFRCWKCNKRLFDLSDLKKIRGKIEVKCPRCGEINYICSGASGISKGEFITNN